MRERRPPRTNYPQPDYLSNPDFSLEDEEPSGLQYRIELDTPGGKTVIFAKETTDDYEVGAQKTLNQNETYSLQTGDRISNSCINGVFLQGTWEIMGIHADGKQKGRYTVTYEKVSE